MRFSCCCLLSLNYVSSFPCLVFPHLGWLSLLYSLSHPPSYLSQPCSGTRRLNYILRTNTTVFVQAIGMNRSLWMCVCIKGPELAVLYRRYTIKPSPPSLSQGSFVASWTWPLYRGQSPQRWNFDCFKFGGGGKITFFWKICVHIFLMNILYFFLHSQVSLVYGSTMGIFKQWIKFSFDFPAGSGVYEMRLVVR